MLRKIIKGLEQNLSIILQGFHIIAIFENTSKYDSDSKEDIYREVPLQQIWML